MYDVIFVRLKQNLSRVFGKYQLQYANFWFGTSLDHAHCYCLLLVNILGIKYSMHDAILLGLCKAYLWFSESTSYRPCPLPVYDQLNATPTSIFIIVKYSMH